MKMQFPLAGGLHFSIYPLLIGNPLRFKMAIRYIIMEKPAAGQEWLRKNL